MRRLFSFPVVALACCLSSAAMSQIANPKYIDVYWDSSVSQWNSDVSQPQFLADAGTGMETQFMTVDTIHSLLYSTVNSDYLQFLSGYGSSAAYAPVYPSVVEGNCGAPPATVQDAVNAFESGSFISCLLADQAGNDAGILDSNTVIILFIPPQVGAAIDAGEDWCLDQNPQDPGSVTGGENDYVDGREAAFVPLNKACDQYLVTLGYIMTHELVEATVGQICDRCEDGGLASGLSFLGSGFAATGPEVAKCLEAGTTDTCIPSSTPPLDAGQGKFCGSGGHMVLQALVDPRNSPPWDLNPIYGYEGSSYLGIADEENGFQAGYGHSVGFVSPVETGAITWTQADAGVEAFVEVNGFGAGYGNMAGQEIINPGDQLQMQVFDPVWGQPSSIFGLSELPQQFSSVSARWQGLAQAGSTINISGFVLGSSNCGLPGHTLASALPIENTTVTASSLARGDINPQPQTTNADGYFSIPFVATRTGNYTLQLQAGQGAVTTEVTFSVHPTIISISPDVGSVDGGQSVVVNGEGFDAGMTMTFESPTGTWVSTAFNPTSSTTFSHSTPSASLLNMDVGEATVFVTVEGLASNALPYLYVIPGVPYLQQTSQDAGVLTCYPTSNSDVAAAVYDVNGNEDAGITISFSVASPSAVTLFTPTSVSDPGVVATSLDSASSSSRVVTATVGSESASITLAPHDDITDAVCGSIGTMRLPITTNYLPICLLGCATPTDITYENVSGDWINPDATDPFYSQTPIFESFTSTYEASELTIKNLGAASILGDLSGSSFSSYAQQVETYAAREGSNLCMAGPTLSISAGGRTPNWSGHVFFPTSPAVPEGYYRVFGLNQTANTWVELEISTETGGVLAAIQTTDPHGRVEGTIAGPYALARYTNSDCNAGSCIPKGSTTEECDGGSSGDTNCCLTSDGGAIGCNSGVCCNIAGGACDVDTDCCGGNTCLGGICRIYDGQGYCGSGASCVSGLCPTGSCECYGSAAIVDAGNPDECCSGKVALIDAGVWQCQSSTEGTSCSIAEGPISSCNPLSEMCDPDGGICRITGPGSAYEPCSESSQCSSWPVPLTCQSSFGDLYGECCGPIASTCFFDSDCCPTMSCSGNQTAYGTCKLNRGYFCTSNSECLFGNCSGYNCQ